ncbi:MAG: hypothetical protein ACJ8AW_54130 [Rhodopila sp.]
MAKLVRDTHHELMLQCGDKPTAVQRAMIDQIIQLKLRLAAMDKRFAETGARTDHDSHAYLAWSNSLIRLLRDLGTAKVRGRTPPSVAELLGEPSAKQKETEAPSVADLLRASTS